MRIHAPLVQATFLQRLNRFAVSVRIGQEERRAHLPNSGALGELLIPGAELLLAHRPGPHRVTDYDLIWVRHNDTWVSVDARLPPRLFIEALSTGKIPAFAGYGRVQGEVRYGDSRLDFLLTGAEVPGCLTEVKSCTLVEGDIARFPDVPTLRGVRHLRELMAGVEEGLRAAIVFVVQRPDATAFAAHTGHDPLFARTLQEAISLGVEAYAYLCDVNPPEITLTHSIPVLGAN